MQRQLSRIRVIAAIGASAVAALVISSSSHGAAAGIPEQGGEKIATAVGAKPKPKCQGALVSLGTQGQEGFGLELYTWTVCGRRGGVPFG